MTSSTRSIGNRAPAMAPDDRRRAIITATLPLLRQYGKDISTRQIARAAGIAEGTIFRVFPNKEALIDKAIEAAFDTAAMLAQFSTIDRNLPLSPKLLEAVSITQKQLSSTFALLAKVGLPRPPQHDAKRHGPEDEIMAVIVELFQPHADQLRVTVLEAARMLRVMIFAGTHPILTGGEALSADEIVQLYLYGAIKPAEISRPTPSEPENRTTTAATPGDVPC